MTKISDLSALTGAGVDSAVDLLPIVDMSEVGAARNKKITVAEFFLAIREAIDDRMDTVLVAGTNVALTYDDGAGTITIDAATAAADVSGLSEAIDDRVAALLTAGANVTLTYNDGAGTLTIASTGGGGGGSVSDTVYGVGWDGDTTNAPSKNAVYDKIEAVVASIPAAYAGGVQSVPILASAMTARTTNGAAAGTTETTTNKVMLPTLDFDASTIEYAQFLFPMPKSWNEGTITATFIWTAASGSGNVIWGLQAVAISEADPLDVAFGTAQEVTDALTTALDNHTSSATPAITVGGTPAAEDLVAFQVYRKASDGSDTLAVDAKLLAVVLKLTTNAADDS